MTDTAIKVENLSKRYPSLKLCSSAHSGRRPSIKLCSLRTSRIGLEEEVSDTMSGAPLNFLKQPGRNLRRFIRWRMSLCYNSPYCKSIGQT
jgi:hypothetical protein